MNQARTVTLRTITVGIIAAALGSCASPEAQNKRKASETDASAVGGKDATFFAEAQDPASSVGAFSMSLAVKDLKASREFYEHLGFVAAGGAPEQGWQILRNGAHVIGLFQGMFEQNIMTFNPGWSQGAEPIAEFTDVRDLQKQLQDAGIALTTQADPASTGPASLTLADPDGNLILIDQHVPAPK